MINITEMMRNFDMLIHVPLELAGPHSSVGSASDSRARGPGFDIR